MTTGLPTKQADEGLARAILLLCLLLFLGLGAIYSTAVPIFEKPDEYNHYFYVQHLLEEHALPVHGETGEELWKQEASQPPLYYSLAALVVSPIYTSDARQLLWINPQRNMGNPSDPGNKNVIVHTGREDWPYRGATLAVHVARWLSLLFGAGAVMATYGIGRLVIPDRPLLAAGAAALHAFIPQFLFISSSVSNDSLITWLAGLVLLQLIAIVRRPPRREMAAYVCLGCMVGLAALTKVSGLTLLALCGVTLAWVAWRRSTWRTAVYGALIIGGLTAAIAGWWYLRNLRLYGEFTAIGPMLEALGNPRAPFRITFDAVRRELVGLRASFWGLFGWFSILMPEWVYLALDSVTALGVVGLVRWARTTRPEVRAPLGLMALWLILVSAALARWTLMIRSSQGRLLFPALPGIAVMLALGWSSLAPTRWRTARDAVPLGLAAALFSLSVVVPAWIIEPAYSRPLLMEPGDIPADLARIDVTFGDQIRLFGCKTNPARLRPGESLQATCYWQALAPIETDYYVFTHLLGARFEPVGKENGYPGSGTYPLSLWPVGPVVAATERLRVAAETAAPVLGRLAVGLYDPATKESLPAVAPQGNRLDLTLAATVKVAPPAGQRVLVPNPVRYSVGDLAALVGYRIEQEQGLRIILYWESTAEPTEDLTVFVHLLDELGHVRGQGDGPPMDGDYPTSFWEPGETVVDSHLVEVDPDAGPGSYRVAVGFYRPADESRLPVQDAAGVVLPDGRILLPIPVTLP